MNKGLPYQHHAPAKNVHGIKRKRETKTLKDSQRSSTLQKGSSAVPKLLILTQGLNHSGELAPVTLILRDLQSISQKCNEISMWETQLEIKYEDYQLEDVNLDHLMNNTAAILQSLTSSKLKQMEGTDLQSANESW